MTLPTQQELAKLPHLFQVRYALYAATKVAHLTKVPQAATCLRVVEAYLAGKASKADCRVAGDAAAGAAYYAARAAYAAAGAAYYAAAAGAAAAGAAANAANATAAANAANATAAADAAANAAYAAAGNKAKAALVKDLRRYYEELLNFDSISEAYLLG